LINMEKVAAWHYLRRIRPAEVGRMRGIST